MHLAEIVWAWFPCMLFFGIAGDFACDAPCGEMQGSIHVLCFDTQSTHHRFLMLVPLSRPRLREIGGVLSQGRHFHEINAAFRGLHGDGILAGPGPLW